MRVYCIMYVGIRMYLEDSCGLHFATMCGPLGESFRGRLLPISYHPPHYPPQGFKSSRIKTRQQEDTLIWQEGKQKTEVGGIIWQVKRF